MQPTECPKIYRKSVLHLLKYNANIYWAVNFRTLSTHHDSPCLIVTCELPLLGGRIKGDGLHALAAAEGGSLAGGEAGATVPPAHKVVTPLITVST